MFVFRKATILHKLLVLIAAPVAGIAAVAAVLLLGVESRLADLPEDKARSALQASLSVVKDYQQLAEDGVLTEAEAQERALDLLSKLREPTGTGYTVVFDDALRLKLHPVRSDLIGEMVADFRTPDGLLLFQEAKSAAEATAIGVFRYKFRSPTSGELVDKHAAAARVDQWGWTVYSGAFDTEAEQAMLLLMRDLALAGLIAAVSCAALAIAISHSIAQPFYALRTHIRRLAAGDLDSPAPDLSHAIEAEAVAQATEVFRRNALELSSVRKSLEEALDQQKSSAQRLALRVDEQAIKLEQAEGVFELAAEVMTDAMFDWDVQTNTVRYSDKNWRMLGYARKDWPDTFASWESRVHEEDLGPVKKALTAHLAGGPPYTVQYRILAADGRWRWWRSQCKALRDASGEACRLIGVNADVTELVEARHQAERDVASLAAQNETLRELRERDVWIAEHDVMTGLPNRRRLERVWPDVVAVAASGEGAVAALSIDLDHFKRVNDSLGHDAGDDALLQVVARFKDLLAPGEHLARAGGDEFVVLLPSSFERGRPCALADQVIAAVKKPFLLNGFTFHLGASVGIARAAAGDATLGVLLTQANAAMHAAKSAGRLRARAYGGEDAARADERRRLTNDLYQALEEGEIEAFYQPQVRAADYAIIGAEALARWRHPELGIVPPMKFIPIAEDIGLIDRIDACVMAQAVAGVRSIEAELDTTLSLSVNFSMGRLSDGDLMESMQGLTPPRGGLSAEVLESVFLEKADDTLRWNLDQLRAHGVKIDLDDFGSGHASLLSLTSLKPNRIKLDRQLVQNSFDDPANMSILKAINEMARTLGIRVLAEGVETAEQADHLRMICADELQGYHFGRPGPLAAFRDLVAQQLARSA